MMNVKKTPSYVVGSNKINKLNAYMSEINRPTYFFDSANRGSRVYQIDTLIHEHDLYRVLPILDHRAGWLLTDGSKITGYICNGNHFDCRDVYYR
jgi:hypothetical protein